MPDAVQHRCAPAAPCSRLQLGARSAKGSMSGPVRVLPAAGTHAACMAARHDSQTLWPFLSLAGVSCKACLAGALAAACMSQLAGMTI